MRRAVAYIGLTLFMFYIKEEKCLLARTAIGIDVVLRLKAESLYDDRDIR